MVECVAAVLAEGGEETGKNFEDMCTNRRAIAAEDLAGSHGLTNGLFGAPAGGVESRVVEEREDFSAVLLQMRLKRHIRRERKAHGNLVIQSILKSPASNGQRDPNDGYAGAYGYEEARSGDPLALLGWLHIGERYYAPELGRFVQRDPIGIRGGLNTYLYILSNPPTSVDPSGRDTWIVGTRFGHQGVVATNPCGGYVRGDFAAAGWVGGDNITEWIRGPGIVGVTEPATITGPDEIIIEHYRTPPSGDRKTIDWIRCQEVAPSDYCLFSNNCQTWARKGAGMARPDPPDRPWIGLWCFARGTLIHTESGLVPIEEVCVGDCVLATDILNGATYPASVTDVRHASRPILLIELQNAAVYCTEEHPFYVNGHGWVVAGELTIGQQLRGLDGSLHLIANKTVFSLANAVDVYSITVDSAHTFHICEAGYLVHNKP